MTVRVPPRGTRGTRIPKLPGWLARFMSRVQLRLFRRRHGGYIPSGLHGLVLHTTGARSGQPRTAMLGYLEEPDAWLVIASLAGAARHPAWFHNLASHPEAVIELADGSRNPVRAETVEGTDLEEAWARIAVEAPVFTGYRTKTDREIPVIRLRRR
jgi:deazaflavin-dependent oxidoreductase (nitroreductase family)